MKQAGYVTDSLLGEGEIRAVIVQQGLICDQQMIWHGGQEKLAAGWVELMGSSNAKAPCRE